MYSIVVLNSIINVDTKVKEFIDFFDTERQYKPAVLLCMFTRRLLAQLNSYLGVENQYQLI